ncbi:unnamed protein product [Rhizophagus irregularis]|nr:unnamed protein product [Rhizophagus irregularis]
MGRQRVPKIFDMLPTLELKIIISDLQKILKAMRLSFFHLEKSTQKRKDIRTLLKICYHSGLMLNISTHE